VETLYGPDTLVPCIVFTGLSLAEEADLYIKAQDGKPMSKMQVFEAEIAAGAEIATALIKIAEDNGFAIDSRRQAGHVTQSAARFVYDNFGPDGLARTFAFITGHFGSDQEAYSGGFFMGVGQALAQVKDDALAARAIKGATPGDLRGSKSGYAGRDATRVAILRAVEEYRRASAELPAPA
jgi:hypothetical protein